jgi:hypothetical protein
MMKKDLAKEYFKEIEDICKLKDFKIHTLGFIGKRKEYPLLTIEINHNNKTKRTVCFSCGIHGYEIAGPLSALKFLKQFKKTKIKNTKIIIFPLINPYGYNHNIRLNHNDLDLNRLFCVKRPKDENKLLIDYIKKQNIVFFHSLHEDVDENRFYIYLYEMHKEPIYNKILKIAKKIIPIDLDKKIYADKANHGLILNKHDGSFEDYMFLKGTPFSMCTETPGKKPLQKRIKLNIEIMNEVISFCEKYKRFK